MYAEDHQYLRPSLHGLKASLHDSFDLAFTPSPRRAGSVPVRPGIFAFRDPLEQQLAFAGWLDSIGALGALGAIPDFVSDAGKWIGRKAKQGVNWVGRKAEQAYDATIGEAVEWVGSGVNWVVEQVKDFDKWMERNLNKIGLGGVYRTIADTVIKIGTEALIVVGEAVDGAIDLIIVQGGQYIGALAAGLACTAGNVVGLAIPPTACAAVGAQIGDLAGKTVGKLRDKLKKDFKDAMNPKDVPVGVQMMQRGMSSVQCPMLPPTELVLIFDEPPPAWTPQRSQQYFLDLKNRTQDPRAKGYYDCRAKQFGFSAMMGRLTIPNLATAAAAVNRMSPALRGRNLSRTLTNLNVLGMSRGTNAGFVKAGNNVRLTHASTKKSAPPAKTSDNTWLLLAAGAVVVGGVAIAKKKGMF